MEKEVFKENLTNYCKIIGVNVTKEKAELMYSYKEKVLEWNKKINLTAITDDKEFILKHLVDSLTINKFIENKKVIDIGTGTGFPGVPIKIVNEDLDITLFDSLNKRISVLKEISKELDIKNIEFVHGRAEETFKNMLYREKYDIAISRAVAELNVLVELMLPAVKVGGICICMKGNNAQDEIDRALNAINVLGGKIENIEKVIIPDLNLERNIIIIKKIKPTPKDFPRKPGTPQKKPL